MIAEPKTRKPNVWEAGAEFENWQLQRFPCVRIHGQVQHERGNIEIGAHVGLRYRENAADQVRDVAITECRTTHVECAHRPVATHGRRGRSPVAQPQRLVDYMSGSESDALRRDREAGSVRAYFSGTVGDKRHDCLLRRVWKPSYRDEVSLGEVCQSFERRHSRLTSSGPPHLQPLRLLSAFRRLKSSVDGSLLSKQ